MESVLKLSVQPFFLPKAGNHPEEYEDAWGHDEKVKRLVIADGANDSINSGLWARALVRAFLCKPPIPNSEAILRWLESPTRAWNEGIHWDRLPWYAVEKARRGPVSTLLGVTFAWSDPNRKGGTGSGIRWQAMAVGDSCLFQIRGDEVIVCFPVTRSMDFGTTPPLLSTQLEYNRCSLKNLTRHEGDCQLGDLFVLATDALAKWFLQRVEAGEQPWRNLVDDLTMEKFVELVDRLRQEHAMRNDDVTLLLGYIDTL